MRIRANTKSRRHQQVFGCTLYVNKNRTWSFWKERCKQQFCCQILRPRIRSLCSSVKWRLRLLMAFKFVYQRAPWPTSTHRGFTQSDLCSTFSPVFLSLTHFDSPQFPQWPIGSASEPNKTYPIRSRCISHTNLLEEMKRQASVCNSRGPHTRNGAFGKGGRWSEAPNGMRAKEKEVARVREEMKARSHDKSDRKSSEFSHGAGGARWMEAAHSTSGTLALSGTPAPGEPVARWVPAQMQMSDHQRETIGQGARWWARGEADRRREGARERVPSPPLFIATIDRGVCALIQVDHLLELDKRARAWALCCHSWSVR